MPTIDTTLQPSRSPTHRCRECGAYWMEWPDSWSLCSKECGPCCDNSADFRSKLNALIVSTIFVRAETLDSERAAHAQFRQEVSDDCAAALDAMCKSGMSASERAVIGARTIMRHILPDTKPDPLVEVQNLLDDGLTLEEAIGNLGLKLVEVGDAD